MPYLQAHPGAKVEDVAEVFGVSEKQLRSDLDLVFLCGLPGHGPGDLIDVSYEGDTVSVSNADTIARPLRLTAQEGLALIVALRTLAELPGIDGGGSVQQALAKLESATGTAADVADKVEVVVEGAEASLAIARQAVAEKRLVHLSYHVPGRDETTERDVDPMRLLLVEGRSYLEGWCRRAEAVRLFRLDRVLAITLLDAPSEPPAEAQERDVTAGLFQSVAPGPAGDPRPRARGRLGRGVLPDRVGRRRTAGAECSPRCARATPSGYAGWPSAWPATSPSWPPKSLATEVSDDANRALARPLSRPALRRVGLHRQAEGTNAKGLLMGP